LNKSEQKAGKNLIDLLRGILTDSSYELENSSAPLWVIQCRVDMVSDSISLMRLKLK